jgi:hypothetical protein
VQRHSHCGWPGLLDAVLSLSTPFVLEHVDTPSGDPNYLLLLVEIPEEQVILD